MNDEIDPPEVIVGPGRSRRRFGLVGAALIILIPAMVGLLMLRNPEARIGAARATSADQIRSSAQSSDDDSVIDSAADLLTPTEGAGSTRITYVSDDGEVSIANGGVVPLSPDLQVELFMAPYPPTDANLDLDFYLTSQSGTPVVDAEITVVYDMIYMRHGPFDARVENIGGGHYLADLDFVMFGPWELVAEFTAPGTGGPIEQSISMFVWPL